MASHKLYITGNGFDLHHGVKSSYYDFKNYLKKANPELLTELESFIDCENIWSDFENSLAFLSREKIMEAVDIGLPNKDPDDEDFSVAEYEIALEQATGRVWQFTDNLKYWFHKWIKKMNVSNIEKYRCLQLDKDAFFINFNYTDLLETCYQISGEQIIYLHGNKNDKVESIILGHGHNPDQTLTDWIRKNRKEKRFQPVLKNKKGKFYHNNRLSYFAWFVTEKEMEKRLSPVRYYAIDRVVGEIEDYYEKSQKKVSAVLKKHEYELNKLEDVQEIIILGHSLSEVDREYFKYLQTHHKNPESIKWKISYHSENDLERIDDFIRQMNIERERVRLFRLNDKKNI
jgi:hypothetical protein